MTRRQRLTKGLVEACTPRPRDRFLWDAEVAGFGVKVTPAGGRTYVLQYRAGGRSRRYAIGRHGAPWTVETARQRARVLLRILADGRDPQAERVAARADVTVAALCDLYLAEGLAGRSPNAVASARRSLENHVKPWLGARLASQVTVAEVEHLLRAVTAGASPSGAAWRAPGGRQAANAALSALSAALGFGVRRGLCRENPVRGVRRYVRRKVARFLGPAEYARLGRVLATAEALGVPNPVAVGAIRLLLLTGLRPGELLALKRGQLSAAGGFLRLADHHGRPRRAYLGPAALAAIAALPQIPGNPHVFPGRGREGRLSDLQPVWARLRAAAGLPDVRLLDLRHSFASLGAATGDSLLVVGRLLGARDAQTLARYPHTGEAGVKAAAERISAAIAAMLGETPAEVQPPPGFAETAAAGLLDDVALVRWLTPAAAARRSGLTVGTLAAYRLHGDGPGFRRVGGRVVYPEPELEAWAAAREIGPRLGRPPNSRRRS